jgi:hypothetical protein
MKRGKPAGFVLNDREPLQVADAVLDLIADPEHHCRSCPQSHLMGARITSSHSCVLHFVETRARTSSSRISPPPPGIELGRRP